ncbi:thiolase family protein [Salinigranum salinum]|uniref:thiolase family protein n=1 Tax=Salinigranum salinum TaxID=1364937 RepID=UPI0012610B1B|nr:thiolase family protein [Salinigranum salinum]
MSTPVVAAACRTPQGKASGVFADVRSEDLSVALIDHLLDITGLDPTVVEDLLWGCAQQRGEQDANLARVVALLSDLGEETPAATLNRWCASSMQAVVSAADAVAAGNRDCVVAGGVESMSRVPLSSMPYGDLHPRLQAEYDVAELEMGATAEKVADVYDVSREAQDEYALRSQRHAAEATDSGRFDDEIVPIGAGDDAVTEDEGLRRDTSLDDLAGLPPAFAEDGTVTAGNASQISDGAALVLVTSESFADDYGLDVLARVGTNHVAGVDPTVMGIGPVPATRGLLDRAGTDIDDYDLVELNEAFASQTVYCRRELAVDEDRLNVNGGAIAIGHPLGASGARLPVTLLHEMRRRDASRGLATLCVGFGQGAAIEFVRSG